jgi:hypothetical protein
MQRFYADVGSSRLAVRHPVIHRFDECCGVAVTFEQELPGVSLQQRLALMTAPYLHPLWTAW